jgi:Mu transposase, C-terminal
MAKPTPVDDVDAVGTSSREAAYPAKWVKNAGSLPDPDMTLAAYVSEEVVIRYDPRDVGEIRAFHENKFLCRAIRGRAGAAVSRCGA